MSLLETKPTLMVGPAWGRTYTDPTVARQDWADGKDFKILTGADIGGICNKDCAKSLTDQDYTQVSIRLEAHPYAVIIKLDPNA